jgi:hypothetical protein
MNKSLYANINNKIKIKKKKEEGKMEVWKLHQAHE